MGAPSRSAGAAPVSPPELLYNGEPLEDVDIPLTADGQLDFAGFQVRNAGSVSIQTLAIRFFLSAPIVGFNLGIWAPFPTTESGFPTALYVASQFPLSPGETLAVDGFRLTVDDSRSNPIRALVRPLTTLGKIGLWVWFFMGRLTPLVPFPWTAWEPWVVV